MPNTLVKSKWSSGYLQFTDNSGNIQAAFNANGFQAYKLPVVAKTASYTVTAAESGTLFTTTGATGAVEFTLPSKAAGLHFWFFNTVDQNMTVTADAVDTIVTFNDAAADSVATSTSSEKTPSPPGHVPSEISAFTSVTMSDELVVA